MSFSLLKQFSRIAFVFLAAATSIQSWAATQTVKVQFTAFNPKDITVNVGDTVTWAFLEAGHDTVANDGTWSSGMKAPGTTFSFTFTAAHAGKRFDYFCTPHRQIGMVGSITVRAAANQPPTVSISSPQNGSTFLTTDTVTFNANAADADGTVSKVEFFADGSGTPFATDTSSPFSATGQFTAGTHSITARATDNAGATGTSSPISITVNAPNQAPTVNLTAPQNGGTFLTTDTITFGADATDDAGVNRVEFYSDGNLIGTDTSAPYSVTASLPTGQHLITAKAFDGPGLSTTSGGNIITVNAPNAAPTVSLTTPQNNATFSTADTITFSADAADDAGVNRVEFFVDGDSIGTDTSAPYSIMASLAAGTHTITAKAFDGPGLSTTSAPIQIVVSQGGTAPHINSVARNGTTTTIVASATDNVVHDLEATTDFVNWTVVDTKTATNGTVTLTDTTSETMRFYRIAAR